MNIMISGGGTGGHIYPAITIYKTLQTMVDANFLYVGTEKRARISHRSQRRNSFYYITCTGIAT